jgi:hypothetical protein
MMTRAILVARTVAALLCFFVVSMLAHAGTLRRHWGEMAGLRYSNATIVTKDGHRFRGHLVITQAGVIVTHHGTGKNEACQNGASQGGALQAGLVSRDSREIPRGLVARIVVRHRYSFTLDKLEDGWWSVGADWKGIFYPEVSNIFPIAMAAEAVATAGVVMGTPIVFVLAVCLPPRSDTVEILPD